MTVSVLLRTLPALRNVRQISKKRKLSTVDFNLSSFYLGRNFSISKEKLKCHQKLSYCHVPTEEPLVTDTIGEVINRTAEKFGNREAVVFCHDNVRKNFIELREDVDRFAAGLLSLGLQKGDRIGICSPNKYEWLLTQYAAAKAGLVLVSINPAYQTRELEYCMKKVGIRAVVSAESYKTQNYYNMFAELVPSLKHSKPGKIENNDRPELKNFTHLIMISNKEFGGAMTFNDVLASGNKSHANQLDDLQKEIDFDNVACIQFTSGTTGYPKGVILTHHNLMNSCKFFGRRLGYHENYYRFCVPVPLYHVFGAILCSYTGIYHGCCQVFPAPTFNAKAMADVIQNERCNILHGTPTMYIDIANLPDVDKYDFSSAKILLIGGSPAPLEICKNLQKKFNVHVLNGFGMTEGSCAILVPKLTDKPEVQMTKATPLTHTEVKIIDNKGKTVERGVRGELLIRGPSITQGYFDEPEKTAEVKEANGWLHSGDMAVMDNEGCVQIIGRLKDLIIRGGVNISPAEIEEFLHKHPKVLEAQIVGVPDSRFGEEICAWVSVKSGETLTEKELKEFCKDQIAHYKIPKYILFTDVFPKTVTGKIQKQPLQEKASKMLNLLTK